jgi:calcineurin-like phosphoesterase family protein
MKIFVTSNQQFGRPNAIKLYKRPFESVKEMNQSMIDVWNSVVSQEDKVYVLGNFAWDPETAENSLKELNGEIIAIVGEHDTAIEEIDNMKNIIKNVSFNKDSIEYFHDAQVTMSYWPLTDWPGKSKGILSVIGHPNKKYRTDHKKGIINCSCDFWEFKPLELSKIKDLFTELKSED